MRPVDFKLAFAGLFALGILLAAGRASAQPAVPGMFFNEWKSTHDRSFDPEPPEFRFISYFFTRMSGSNMVSDPSGLKGVSLGPIGQATGSGTRVRDEDGSTYFFEQRWIPVISYAPHFIDGLASFNAMFEVDFLWGFGTNSVLQNSGGAFNADQINFQTKNVNVSIHPTRNPSKLSLIIGTQPLYDNLANPLTTSVFDIARTGYKMSFMASDGTGISAYGKYYGLWKASVIFLNAAQPDRALDNDPRLKFAWMMTLDYAYPITPSTVIGLSFWRLQDETKGQGKVFENFVDAGPSSAGLAPFTGVRALPLRNASGSVYHLGAHFNHNIRFHQGDFGASGFVMANLGSFQSNGDLPDGSGFLPEVKVQGGAANLELLYNWGKTSNDVITLEGMFSTGDSNPGDDRSTSAFTMNYYGLPGAVWFNHKTLILFPFTKTINNYTGAITDISNQGFGLVSAIASGAWDIIPYKLNFKLGAAYAQAAVKPTPAGNGAERGRTVGAEINAELEYHIRYLMTVGLHGGVMFTGNFFDGADADGLDRVSGNVWATFLTYTWYAF